MKTTGCNLGRRWCGRFPGVTSPWANGSRWLLLFVLLGAGCSSSDRAESITLRNAPRKLSDFGLFVGDPREQVPASGVIPYDLNTPLFSDYTSKYRFIRLPSGASATYHPTETFALPVGTVIAKTFASPYDRTDPSQGERLLETRILTHQPEGWIGLPYVWNEDQTEAALMLAGTTRDVRWVHDNGAERTNDYIIPNANQCKGCHKWQDRMAPIGPKARHLNRDFVYGDKTENQLVHWSKVGALQGAPAPEGAPRLAVWNDESTGSIDARARAWLEVNCAHCHNPHGPASNSGLDLMAAQTEPVKFGVFKAPVAAGRGSGGLAYNLVPGEPDASILAYRIASTEPQVMMPELGKRLVHTEGVALVRKWISEMESSQN